MPGLNNLLSWKTIRLLKRLVLGAGWMIWLLTGHVKAQELPGRLSQYQDFPASLSDTLAINTILHLADSLQGLQPDTAIQLYQQALLASLQLRYDTGVIASLKKIVHRQYRDPAEQEETKAFLHRLRQELDKRAMRRVKPHVLNALAVLFAQQINHDSSVHYFSRAIALADSLETFNMAGLYNNFGVVLIQIDQYQRALYYLELGEQYARRHGHTLHLIQAIQAQGNAYTNLRKWPEAREKLELAAALARKHNYLEWQFLALGALGYNYLLQKEYDKALVSLNRALSIDTAVNPFFYNMVVTTLGKVYYYKGAFQEAETYLKRALVYAEKWNIPRDLMECNQILAYLHAQKGSFEQAFEYHLEYSSLKDSLEGISTKQHINQLEVQYRTSLKDKELAEKELLILKKDAGLRRKSNWIAGITAGAVVFGLLGALSLALYRNSVHKRRLQEQQLRTLEQEQEIKQMKAIMQGEEAERDRIARELHDGIGGLLAGLKMNFGVFKDENPELEDSETLNRMSGQINVVANEVRRTAHNLMPDMLIRAHLKEALLQYAEQLNHKHLKVVLQYHVPSALTKGAEIFLYRVVQELLQNVLKHAQATYVIIQLMELEGKLCLIAEDDGRGFKSNASGTGSGLRNIAHKAESMDGELHINSGRQSGTIVQITLPMEALQKL